MYDVPTTWADVAFAVAYGISLGAFVALFI